MFRSAWLNLAFVTSTLVACGVPSTNDPATRLSAPPVQTGNYASKGNTFRLFRADGEGQWREVSKIAASSRSATLVIHGFKATITKRGVQALTPRDVSRRLSLFNPSTDDLIPPPVGAIDSDLYALLWDSEGMTPWELEDNRLGGRFLPSLWTTDFLRRILDHDPVADGQKVGFFDDLFRYFDGITDEYQGSALRLAGFSKGGHLAIKLAEYATRADQEPEARQIGLALLEPYVGPNWANAGLGQELVGHLRTLKKRGIGILNVTTSEIYDYQFQGLAFADRGFKERLVELVGEIKIKASSRERAARNARLGTDPVKDLSAVVRGIKEDHGRAIRYFLGSALVCDHGRPSINSPLAAYGSPALRQADFENPREVTDWIFDGKTAADCGPGEPDIPVY